MTEKKMTMEEAEKALEEATKDLKQLEGADVLDYNVSLHFLHQMKEAMSEISMPSEESYMMAIIEEATQMLALIYARKGEDIFNDSIRLLEEKIEAIKENKEAIKVVYENRMKEIKEKREEKTEGELSKVKEALGENANVVSLDELGEEEREKLTSVLEEIGVKVPSKKEAKKNSKSDREEREQFIHYG